MLLKKETSEKFGYEIDSLSKGSHKQVITKCDYCGENSETTFKNYNNKKRDVVDKDACWNCRHLKREEINMIKYGVRTNFEREDCKEKAKKTNLERYGSEYQTQTENFKEKTKKTMKERYGAEYLMQSEKGRELVHNTKVERYGEDYAKKAKKKAEETSLKKYGVRNAIELEEFKQKVKETNLERYGVESHIQSEEGKRQRRETIKERYGVEHPGQIEEGKEKRKKTSLERYGTESPNMSEEVKKKTRKTNLERYGSENVMDNEKLKKKAEKNRFASRINNGTIRVYNGKTTAEWAKETGYSWHGMNKNIKKYGFDKAVNMVPKESSLETLLKDWLISENIKFETQVRVEDRYLDFLVEEKLAIEVDGLYYHCELVIEDSEYHLKKRKLYENKGYTSLFFREDELINKLDVVKNIILKRLGKINAHNSFLFCVGIKTGDADLFIENNSLDKIRRGKCYGLYNNQDLVGCVKIRRKKDGNYEIVNFCVSPNISKEFALETFLNFIKKEFNIESSKVERWIDLRYEDSKFLEKVGFRKEKEELSFRWTDRSSTFLRTKYPANSGYDHNLAKIWDCGQSRYERTL